MEYSATLYDKTGKIKLGELTEILAGSHYVLEERNGIFELSFDYSNGYPLADQLIEENMVEVKPSDEQGLQKFRIYDTQSLMQGIITVMARHESYDLMNDHVENIHLENASCEYALNTLFRNSHFSSHYRGYSDIINAQNYAIENVNVLNAIAGKQGSIIDTYGTGAEILRDGTDIHVLSKRGYDNEVTIEFGKNLTGFKLERDLTDLETRVGGFAKYNDEDNNEVTVMSNWIDSPYIYNFAHPYISTEGRRDYSDKFKDDEIPTVEKLNMLCEDEFKINKRDVPRSNYTIEFIPLSKCVGYEDINDKISLCDTVRIIDKRFNVDTKAKVIKCKYDFIKQRYESMELGEPRTTLGDVIGGNQGPPGKDGTPGKDGADGNVEDFPHSLPNTPMLSSSVLGFASISLNWTFEDKVYYSYELYASKDKDFEPNIFDIIHEGQSSSFLFQAKPGETWYFRVCGKNTYSDRTEFSPQVMIQTRKQDDFKDYFSNLGVGNLVSTIFSADYMEAGIMKGHWIDARNLSVTNGTGVRTLDINSFGDVHLAPRVVEVSFNGISESIKMDENGMSIKNKDGVDMLDLRYGAMYARNPRNGSVVGTYGSSMIGDYNVWGTTIAGTHHSGYMMLGKHTKFNDDDMNTIGDIDPYVRIFFGDFGSGSTAVKKGVYINKGLHVDGGLDNMGFAITNAPRINLMGNSRIYLSDNNYNHMILNVDDRFEITNRDRVMLTCYSNQVIYNYADWNWNAMKIVNANIHDSVIHNSYSTDSPMAFKMVSRGFASLNEESEKIEVESSEFAYKLFEENEKLRQTNADLTNNIAIKDLELKITKKELQNTKDNLAILALEVAKGGM